MDNNTTEEKLSFDIDQIMKMLPHRYPFLLVDKITECVPGKYSKGYKNLTINESFFQGHFPGMPVMPGVLMIEALAQVGGAMVLTIEEFKGRQTLFAAVDKVRFKNMVRPGDRLDMETRLIKYKGPICKCDAKGFVDGKLCVEAELTVALK